MFEYQLGTSYDVLRAAAMLSDALRYAVMR